MAKSRLNDLWQEVRESGKWELLLNLIRGRRPVERSKYLRAGLSGEDRRGKTPGCKNHVAGEREVENYLLGKNLVFKSDNREITIQIGTNAVPLGAKRGQQREVDLLGFDQSNSPVVIEVKITDRNPVYAVIELCEYVWRLRAAVSAFEKDVQTYKPEKRYRGTWGILLAPEHWWLKSPERLLQHRRLIDLLREKTKIRICSLAWKKDTHTLQGIENKCFVIAGRPPIKSWKRTR